MNNPENGIPPSTSNSALDRILAGEMQYDPSTDAVVKDAIGKLEFELGIVYLEEIVKKIENEPGKLDRNTQLYSVGELLRQHCDSKLKQAEAKVEQIIKNTDGEVLGTAPMPLGKE